jgi:hypothetical protein
LAIFFWWFWHQNDFFSRSHDLAYLMHQNPHLKKEILMGKSKSKKGNYPKKEIPTKPTGIARSMSKL